MVGRHPAGRPLVGRHLVGRPLVGRPSLGTHLALWLLVVGWGVGAWAEKLAIIGAGAGGSAAVYFAKELQMKRHVEISIFEKNDYIGGRIKSIRFGDIDVEVGGKDLHEKNLLMAHFGQHYQLPRRPKPSRASKLAIWDGTQMIWKETGYFSGLYDISSMMWRYGLSLVWADRSAKQFIHSFMKLYEDGAPWYSVQEFLRRYRLEKGLEVTFGEHLLSLGCSREYVDELASGISRAIYNQNVSSLTMAAGMITLAGAEEDQLFGYEQNNEVFEKIIKDSSSTFELGRHVLQIELSLEITTEILDDNISKEKNQKEIILHRSTSNVYTITYRKGGTIYKEDFDAVIIATPLELSKIKLIGIPTPPKRQYVDVHVTFVHGVVNYGYFKVPQGSNFTTILSTQNFTKWTQLSVLYWHPDGSAVVKFFSLLRIDKMDILDLFLYIHDVRRDVITAYPELTPKTPIPDYILAHNLFYLNAFESFISVMEGAAISAKNAINILTKEWTNKT